MNIEYPISNVELRRLRKYIYGPGIDQPVSMIEVADANATYYYHFDAPFDYAFGSAQGRLGQRRGAERCGGRYRPDLREEIRGN